MRKEMQHPKFVLAVKVTGNLRMIQNILYKNFLLLLVVISCSSSKNTEKTFVSYGTDFNQNGLIIHVGSDNLIQKFPQKILSYKASVPYFLEKNSFNYTIDKSFSIWQKELKEKITFVKKQSGYADIEISFKKSDHRSGDCEDDTGFSSEISTLAHTFPYNSKCLAGEIHFNSDLVWVLNGNQASINDGRYDLQTVLIHELGHILGFDHNNDKNSVMYTNYQGIKHTLSNYDKRKIQEIYP